MALKYIAFNAMLSVVCKKKSTLPRILINHGSDFPLIETAENKKPKYGLKEIAIACIKETKEKYLISILNGKVYWAD